MPISYERINNALSKIEKIKQDQQLGGLQKIAASCADYSDVFPTDLKKNLDDIKKLYSALDSYLGTDKNMELYESVVPTLIQACKEHLMILNDHALEVLKELSDGQ